jgi:hypothetical protein
MQEGEITDVIQTHMMKPLPMATNVCMDLLKTSGEKGSNSKRSDLETASYM